MSGEDTPVFTAEEILASVAQAVIVTDVMCKVVYWNHAAEELYLWTAEEAIGHSVSELTVPQVAREVAADIMENLRAGRSWTGGFPVRRKDGTIIPAIVADAGLYRDGVLAGIVGVSTNVGNAIRPLLERSSDAAIVLRQDGVVTYASPAVAQLFGWTESIVGTSVVPLLHPDERADLLALMEEMVRQPGAHPPVEVRMLTEQGWTWCEVAVTNLLDDPGVRGLVCNLRRSLRREAHENAEIRAGQLDHALRSRILIEQAKGFLGARLGISPDEAFEHLRRHARRHQMRLTDVARQVLDGDLEQMV